MIRRLSLFLAVAGMPAWADVPHVATDIAPVHSLVSRVMQGVGAPDLILPPGSSPHSYSMRASEAAALERAELVVWIGHDLTPWLEGPLESLAGDAISLSLLEVDGTVLHPYRSEEGDHHDDADHHDEDGHEEAHDDDHEGHEDHENHAEEHHHGEGWDAHAWLDPVNASLWMGVIAEELAAMDPENAASYRDNAIKGQEELAAVQAELSERLDGALVYAVYHDAYQYFEQRFGLKPAFTIADSHAVAPGPKRIAELKNEAREIGLSCVFAEPLENTRIVETVIEGLDAQVLTIDPLGWKFALSGQLYLDLMGELAGAFEACNAG